MRVLVVPVLPLYHLPLGCTHACACTHTHTHLFFKMARLTPRLSKALAQAAWLGGDRDRTGIWSLGSQANMYATVSCVSRPPPVGTSASRALEVTFFPENAATSSPFSLSLENQLTSHPQAVPALLLGSRYLGLP